jgi:hypothetical protein
MASNYSDNISTKSNVEKDEQKGRSLVDINADVSTILLIGIIIYVETIS